MAIFIPLVPGTALRPTVISSHQRMSPPRRRSWNGVLMRYSRLRAAAAACAASLLLAAPAAAAGQFDHATYPAGESPFAAAIADFNGDGRADVATANEGSDDVTVLLRQADGSYAPEAGSPVAVGDGPTSIAAADFNGD